MGWELAEVFPSARRVFEEADRALGFPLSRLCFEGPAEELQLTANTQPAIMTVSVATLRVIEAETGLAACYLAGHSLGEYSALAAAGGLYEAEIRYLAFYEWAASAEDVLWRRSKLGLGAAPGTAERVSECLSAYRASAANGKTLQCA